MKDEGLTDAPRVVRGLDNEERFAVMNTLSTAPTAIQERLIIGDAEYVWRNARAFYRGEYEDESTITSLREANRILLDAVEHYADSNRWACEALDANHKGRCYQKLYRGEGKTGCAIADKARAEAARMEDK